MAEDDAEKAFFQAQAMNADSGDYQAGEDQGADNSDSDDYDPSNTLHDQYSAPLTDSNSNGHVSSAIPQSNPQDQTPLAPETDPSQSAGNAFPSQTPSRAESQASTSGPASGTSAQPQPKTRTIGGFVVEDEDEDDAGDADYEPPAVLGVEDMNAIPMNVPQQPISGNANEDTSTPDVSLDEAAQISAGAKNAPNSSYPPAVASKNDASVPSDSLYNSRTLQSDNALGSATATPAPDSPSTSKGRLPHDRVGILEDRIQEDPRGDIPAWIELLNEHRGRSRIDSARDVYERFLQVFPFSVCPFPPLGFYATSEKLTIFTRPSNGWPTRTWNPSSTSCSVSSRSSIELF